MKGIHGILIVKGSIFHVWYRRIKYPEKQGTVTAHSNIPKDECEGIASLYATVFSETTVSYVEVASEPSVRIKSSLSRRRHKYRVSLRMHHWNLLASLVLVGPHGLPDNSGSSACFWHIEDVMPSPPGLVGEFLGRQMDLRSGNSRDWGCSCDFWLLPWHQGANMGPKLNLLGGTG